MVHELPTPRFGRSHPSKGRDSTSPQPASTFEHDLSQDSILLNKARSEGEDVGFTALGRVPRHLKQVPEELHGRFVDELVEGVVEGEIAKFMKSPIEYEKMWRASPEFRDAIEGLINQISGGVMELQGVLNKIQAGEYKRSGKGESNDTPS